MTIYETDQWTASQVSKQALTVAAIEQAKGEVYGGDADSVRAIFGGGNVRQREVGKLAFPSIGHVWFKAVDGKLEVFRTNYDSSD